MMPSRLVALGLLTLLSTPLFAGKDTLVVSVRGSVSPNYKRTKLTDGTFKPERYVIANGGLFPGTTRDTDMEKVAYPEIAGVVARHLAARQYFLADKAKDADLLIAIYWGTTIPFNDGQYSVAVDGASREMNDMYTPAEGGASSKGAMADRLSVGNGEMKPAGKDGEGVDPEKNARIEAALARIEMLNRHRDDANQENARILGYLDGVNERREMIAWADVGGLQHELMADVEEVRYYVVVQAYDFRELQRTGKKRTKWVTRISIGARGNRFDERFAQMLAAASNVLGQKQDLRRQYYDDPRVELGETKFIGVVGGEGVTPVKPAEAKK